MPPPPLLKKTKQKRIFFPDGFPNHQQGSRSFDSWHQNVVKAAKLIDWTGYDATKAAVDALVLQTSSQKLQQRAIQENPDLDTFIALGMSQEQARKKAASMPGGQEEVVNRLQQENNKPRKKLESKNPQQHPKKGNLARCSRCCMAKCLYTNHVFQSPQST